MKFSILIPAYKSLFLKECIDSILAQSYTDFELIIVNDASPEDLDSIVKGYDDVRIRYYVNKTNCGAINVVDNWNICLSYANGEYVICMGDDDKLLPCCLEEYAKLIENFPSLGVYHGWTQIIDENSLVADMQEPRPLWEDVYSLLWHRWKGRQQYIGDFLFDTALIKKNGGFYKLPLAWGSDDISSVIAAKDTGIANTQVPVFQYRVSSLTISNDAGNIDVKMNAVNDIESWFGEFLRDAPKSDDIVVRTYWRMSKAYMRTEMLNLRISYIGQGLNQSFVRWFLFFMNNRKRYHITAKNILYAWIVGLKMKFKH